MFGCVVVGLALLRFVRYRGHLRSFDLGRATCWSYFRGFCEQVRLTFLGVIVMLNLLLGNVYLYSALGVVGAVAVICLLLVMFAPRHVHVERSVTIHAPPEKIYNQIATLEHWLVWSPWFKRDPDIKINFNDVPRGKGARYEWSGNKHVGTGSMEIVGADEPRRVDLALSFGKQGDAKACFTLDPVPAGELVEVTWGFDTDMGLNPIGRFFGLMMDRFLGPDYEEGLAKLKEICEQE